MNAYDASLENAKTTVLCKHWTSNTCPKGSKGCKFRHDQNAWGTRMPPAAKDYAEKFDPDGTKRFVSCDYSNDQGKGPTPHPCDAGVQSANPLATIGQNSAGTFGGPPSHESAASPAPIMPPPPYPASDDTHAKGKSADPPRREGKGQSPYEDHSSSKGERERDAIHAWRGEGKGWNPQPWSHSKSPGWDNPHTESREHTSGWDSESKWSQPQDRPHESTHHRDRSVDSRRDRDHSWDSAATGRTDKSTWAPTRPTHDSRSASEYNPSSRGGSSWYDDDRDSHRGYRSHESGYREDSRREPDRRESERHDYDRRSYDRDHPRDRRSRDRDSYDRRRDREYDRERDHESHDRRGDKAYRRDEDRDRYDKRR